MFEDGKFVRYDVGTGREIAPGGGKVGMGVDEIRSLYAGRVEETPHKYVEGGKYLGVEDISGGKGTLVFATDGEGKVTSWRVGVPPQEDDGEGCSRRLRERSRVAAGMAGRAGEVRASAPVISVKEGTSRRPADSRYSTS